MISSLVKMIFGFLIVLSMLMIRSEWWTSYELQRNVFM